MKTASTSSQLFHCQSGLFPELVTSVEIGGLTEDWQLWSHRNCLCESLWCGFHCDYFHLTLWKPRLSVRFSQICSPMLDEFYCNFLCVSQRRQIVTGTVEPTDEECEWTSDREEEEELAVSAGWSFSSAPFEITTLRKSVISQDRRNS